MSTTNSEKKRFFWFRRDLRLDDNCGLFHALKDGIKVVPLFIFDSTILDSLEDKYDKRVQFIHSQIEQLQKQLTSFGSTLIVKHGKPFDVWKALLEEYDIDSVYTNHDYEPYAIERDGKIKHLLRGHGVQFTSYKDQCIFEKQEILSATRKPYTVYTPYRNAWLKQCSPQDYHEYNTEEFFSNFHRCDAYPIPSLQQIGFVQSDFLILNPRINEDILLRYSEQRDYPAVDGTTHLSAHLRFGTISVRKCIRLALSLQATAWIGELIWRDFFMMILANFPSVVMQSFKPQYNHISWLNNPRDFEAWCSGKTGYALVDAGMRELNSTGFMHNRVRMVTASFLVKHLLIDWRWGEAYFAQKLMDYDLASNNGNWQWIAGSGCDAAPYFRIFNPDTQASAFDSDNRYCKKWIAEYNTSEYPERIVEHSFARQRCLSEYKRALSKHIAATLEAKVGK